MLHCAEIISLVVVVGFGIMGYGCMCVSGRGSRDEEKNPLPPALRNYIDTEFPEECTAPTKFPAEWTATTNLSGNAHDRRIARRAFTREGFKKLG
jgi:hypothetical protein